MHNYVKPHWHWVSRKTQSLTGVGGKITHTTGIVIVSLRWLHSGEVKLVCCTMIDFHKVIGIPFDLDFQSTHLCVFDPSNFRVYDRLAKEAIRLDYVGKVTARLTAAPIHFLSLCNDIAISYGMALKMGFKDAKYFAFGKPELCRSVAERIYLDIVHLALKISSWSLTSSGWSNLVWTVLDENVVPHEDMGDDLFTLEQMMGVTYNTHNAAVSGATASRPRLLGLDGADVADTPVSTHVQRAFVLEPMWTLSRSPIP